MGEVINKERTRAAKKKRENCYIGEVVTRERENVWTFSLL